jgi:hypothetical protein
MKGKNRGVALGRLLLAAALIGARVGAANELDRSGARTFELERDARALRTQVERAPGASSFDLKEFQRRLHGRLVENPRDPRLEELALELRRLRANADRAGRAPRAAALERSSPLGSPTPIEQPRYLGGPPTPPARTYFGQHVVVLQRSIAEIERRLARGDTTAATRLLQAVESDLATLRRVISAAEADPNLLALEAEIRALEAQLAPR